MEIPSWRESKEQTFEKKGTIVFCVTFGGCVILLGGKGFSENEGRKEVRRNF